MQNKLGVWEGCIGMFVKTGPRFQVTIPYVHIILAPDTVPSLLLMFSFFALFCTCDLVQPQI
jgi:hypothetical protein